jgi:hypothetical protein
MQGMIKRWIAEELQKRIVHVPAVVLLGARQMGKGWEGFAVEKIHSVLPRRSETYYKLFKHHASRAAPGFSWP